MSCVSCVLGRRGLLGQAEIENLDVPARGQHQIGRLDIAMHDSLGVRIVERVGGLHANGDDFGCLQRTLAEALAQRPAFDIFHGQEPEILVLSDLVDGGDVGVSQSGSEARFLDEALHTFGIGGHFGRQNFQRHAAAEAGIVGQIDRAHAALAQE